MTSLPANRISKKTLLALFLVGMVSLVMRLVVGEVLKPIPHYDGMSAAYLKAAVNITDHGVLSSSFENPPPPSSLRMPLFPLVLAGLRSLSHPAHWHTWVISFQYLLGSLVCILVMVLGVQLMGPRVGLLAGFISCFYVEYYYVSIIFGRENMALVFLLSFLICFVHYLKSDRASWLFVASAILGLSILIRPEPLLIGLLLIFFFYQPIFKTIMKNPRWSVLGIGIALFPLVCWTVRNYFVHHEFLLLSSEGTWAMYMGQVFPPDQAYTVADPTAIQMIASASTEMEWVNQMKHAIFSAVTTHPFRNLGWAWLKIQETFIDYAPNRLSLLFPLIWIVLPGMALKGTRFFKVGLLSGGSLSLLHLVFGDWQIHSSVSLLQIGYGDIVLLGIVGFAVFILQQKNTFWKIMAAAFLTQIVSSALYVSHYRQRIYLIDWIFIIGTAFILVEATGWLKEKAHKYQALARSA